MGLVYNERRRQIVKLVKSLGGVVLDTPGSWRYGEELSRFVQTVNVVIGDNFRNDVQGYWSTRNYIVPGAGGFLLTPNVPGLESQFALNKEIAVYDSISELEGNLYGWTGEDEAREGVRRAGYLKARFKHHWLARAATLIEYLADYP
jgi:spore maturation protein CgeB